MSNHGESSPSSDAMHIPAAVESSGRKLAQKLLAGRKLILDRGQSPGDILVFTRALADLKKAFPDWQIDVRTCCPDIFDNSPHLTILDESEPGVEYIDVPYDDIHNSGWSGRHFVTAFHIELEKLLGVSIPQTGLLPEVYLSDAEKSWSSQVEDTFGYRGPFWVLAPGHKSDFPLKQWGFERWQELVDLLRDDIQFVQIGEASQGHKHPKLSGVFSLVGDTSLRQSIRLMYHAQGCVCHVSFPMHLAAAYQKPCVVIAGGREPRRWEMYPYHRYHDTNGCLPCCAYDGCWQTGRGTAEGEKENKFCKNMVGCSPKCMAMITPESVAESVKMYLRGGMAK